MRIAIGSMSHETNTFTDRRTGLDEFRTAAGEDLLDGSARWGSLGGLADVLEEAGVDVAPTYAARALPGGVVEPDAFRTVRERVVSGVRDADPDGVCLALHGSMYVDGDPDPEGTLLAAVRDAVGPDVPVVAALDMHATVTEAMVANLDGVAGYRTAPHTDTRETGERAAALLLDAVRGDAEPVLSWRRMPMLLAGERSETEAEPMRSLMDRLREAERRDGLLDASYFLGFPWCDTPHAGVHAVVVGDAAAGADAGDAADELAAAFWERRETFDFTTEAHDPDGALDEAAATAGAPVVVADTGDIPGAGAREDTVDLLAAVAERGDLGRALVAVVADPDALAACRAAGEGGRVETDLGRFVSDGDPFPLGGDVTAVRRVEGVTAALVDAGGAEVLVTDERTNLHRDPDYLREFGVAPTDFDLVAMKSGYLSPAWKEVAARRLFALTPGDTNQVLADLPFEEVPRPLYPLDEDARWSP
ncbi:MAG: M81 family metallopeptidase [Halobacteriaceae archaeon]